MAAASLPSDRLHFGLANQPGDFSWMQSSGVPWKYRYQYLTGGVNTGSGWETWNTPPGQFATYYMSDSDSIGAIPVFTYYEILQSLPHVGATELDSDYSNLNNTATMLSYYANFALLMNKAKTFGKAVVVHVEPDLFAYMEQKAAGGDASTVSASVASSGYSGLGALPNTLQGFTWALLTLRDAIAPNVVLATHASTWASGVDIGLNTDPNLNLAANADAVGAFLNSGGIAPNPTGSTFDAVFNDVADRDSGTPSGHWWDRSDTNLPDFKQWLTWMTELHAKTARQLVVWQVPVGNQYFDTMNQTAGHYQDNRAEYFLSHVSALQAAGIVAVLFGSGGNDNSTTYTDADGDGITNPATVSTFECNLCNNHTSVWSDDDGGYLRIFVGQYYATASSAPTVSSLAPNAGPAAGGTSVTITGTNFTGATAVKFGATTASYTVNSATQISATSPAGSGTVNVTVTTAGGTSAVSTADQFTLLTPGSVYTAVTPVRLLDTRNGGTLGSGGSLNLTIGGRTFGSVSVPANASAVVLNVTATNESAAGFFTVYPTGGGLPTASNLNFAARETVPNLVSVGLGSGGQITIYNGVGSADAVVDLEGYYAPSSGGTAGELVAVVPARITDTRTGSGQSNAGMTLGAGATLDVQVTGVGGIPPGVRAVVMNVTATNTSAAGFFTVYPTGIGQRPLASNLNWTAGVTVPNRVIVPVGSGGKVSFYNGVGSADLIVDVNGYFTSSSSSGASFRPLTPTRIVDTRNSTGGFSSPLGQGAPMVVTVAGNGGVPSMASATPPTAVVLNVTVDGATMASDLVVWPDGGSRPVASDLNFVAGQTVPNLVIVKLSATGKIDISNDFGSTSVIVDVVGWYG